MHDHDHEHRHDDRHGDARHAHGHNSLSGTAQWQTPHLPDHHSHDGDGAVSDEQRDLDLVAAAFYEGFVSAPDPTSFLRLAGIPFKAGTADGTTLHLLRVEQVQTVDVGVLIPQLGGGVGFAPLPSKLTSRRRDIAFVYSDGTGTRSLTFEEARALSAPN